MGKYREVNTELIELAAQGKTGKEISRILNLDYSTVHAKLRKLNINLPNNHNRLKFDNTVFDNIDTEEKAYWLGFLMADGYVSKNSNTVELSLKGDDSGHLNKYNDFIKNTQSIKFGKIVNKGKEYSRCRCIVTDNHFHNRLIELGCTPQKSLTLKFPDKNIFAEESLVRHFIRGYVDGDGCLSYTKTGRLTIEIIGTKEFLEEIISLYPSYFKRTFHKDKRRLSSNTYFITCSCNNADKFASILYDKSNIYLDRKYERFAVLRRNS